MSKARIRHPKDDPAVRVALLSRRPEKIQLLCCPQCCNWGFYGGGPAFECTVDGCGWHCAAERLTALLQQCGYRTLITFLAHKPGAVLFPDPKGG